MELLNINILNKSGRKHITAYTLTNEVDNYFGAYTYLNVAKAYNDPQDILIDTLTRNYNADEFNPIRYGTH